MANSTNWFAKGESDFPRYNPPAPGTDQELDYSRGWMQAQRLEQISDQEWPLGRDTFFAHYDDKII